MILSFITDICLYIRRYRYKNMEEVAKRLNLIEESQTIAMAKLGRQLAEQGHNVISLSFGQPDFDTPQHIKDAAKKAIDDGYTKYTPVPGAPELRKAISEKFKRENNLDYAPDQIVVSTGAKHSLMNVVLSLVNPGDEVLIPTPYWVSYTEMVKLAEGIPVFIRTSVDNKYKVTAEQIKAAMTPKTKLMIFSSPCNPTGSIYSKDELRAIAEVFADRDNTYIMADEIYEYINFIGKHESIGQFDFIKDKVITVNGVAKGFAMTGWRIGYMGAPKFIADACDKLQGQFTSGANSIAQMATLAALTSDLQPTWDMRDDFLRRRDMVLELMKEIPGFKTYIPDGAFYIYPDVTAYFGKTDEQGNVISNSMDLCMYILNNAYVALVPGEAFGEPKGIRFSYAASDEDLKEALKRIKEVLAKLK